MMQTGIEIHGVRKAGGILDRIVDAKAKRIDAIKQEVNPDSIVKAARASSRRDRRSLATALKRTDRLNIIAEIKQRSPSKGIIRQDFDPVRIAQSYVAGGAAALSVLCEEDFFGGSLEHLGAIYERVGLPLLRKDFIFDPYQLYESVIAGADAVLLIVAILEDDLLAELIALTRDLGLDALVEVHSEEDMERACASGASVIGVNNRDLTTFKVDLDTSRRLAPLVPSGIVLVSESGINSASDMHSLKAVGFNGFLVGEHLLRATNPGDALKSLIRPQ